MAVNLSPVGGAAAQFFDNSGNVLTGGKLYTYDAGTTTPAPTYTTSSGVTAHPNPIVLNAAGRVPDSGEIWLSDSVSYKFVLKDTNDVLIATYDNLVGINSNFVNFTGEEEQQTATQGQTVFTLTTLTYQPVTNNLLVFVNGSKQISGTNYQETSSTVVTFVDGLNVGDVVDFCTATPINTAVVNASQVIYNEGAPAAIDRNVAARLQDYVSVKDFGAVGDGVTDDTDAINTAISYCIDESIQNLNIPDGTYKVTSIVIDGANGLHINATGTLFGALTGSYEAVLVIKNSNDVVIDGKLNVLASYNADYDCGVTLYTDDATQCTNIDLYNIRVIGAQVGYRISKAGTYGASGGTSGPLVAENTIFGGETYGCPKAVEAYGTQTFINFVGTRLIASDTGGGTGWDTLPKGIVWASGATVYVTGGELLLTQQESGYGVQLEPIVDSVFGNQYGSAYIVNVEMECAAQLLSIKNPSSIGSLAAGLGIASFISCAGYMASNSFAAMQVYDTNYSGTVIVKNCPWFANVPANPHVRTFPNFTSNSYTCNVFIDDASFGYGFEEGLGGVVGGVLHFPYTTLVRAENAGTQAFVSNTPATVVFTAKNNSDPDTVRFNSDYNTSTGVFTVPAGGLNSVTVNFSLITSVPTAAAKMSVLINGSVFQTAPTFVGTSAGSYYAGSFDVGSLDGGDTVALQFTQIDTASAAAGGAYDFMSILGKR